MISANEIYDNEGNQLQILGMTGLVYNDGSKKYFIDSELLDGKENDIVIFKNKIRLIETEASNTVDEIKRNEIIKTVIVLLNSRGYKALLM